MNFPMVSVIVPVRNEERFIGRCLRSIIENEYPKEKLEIIVVDGMSEDGTRKIVEKLKDEFENIKILENKYRYTPHALNIGIRNSKGEIFMIAGAHTTYSKNYIRECVLRIEKGYDVVGGLVRTVPSSDTPTARAIARVLSHPFGVGGAKYRTLESLDEDIEVDTVAYGLYRKSVVDRVGYFNENLLRNQDIEFNLRIKRSGGKILLTPKATAYYHARDNLSKLWRNNFSNGFWVIWSLRFSKLPFSLRHLVPLFFILFLIFGGIASLVFKPLLWMYLPVVFLYVFLVLFFSTHISLKERSLKVLIASIVAFLTLHISYGLGSLIAFLKMILSKFV